MKYYSINRNSPEVDFKSATIKGQAPDKGLYFPEYIPKWNADFISNLKNMLPAEIGFEIMKPYVGDSIPDDELMQIMQGTLSFDIPLKKIEENIYCLELFHGPTLAFKDIGARFLSRCLGYFAKQQNEKIIILVATSGDTGGAVADGFYNVPGTEVVILYPSGKVSEVQEKQLTGLGGNIHALEIQGDFDDCQRLVKLAFADDELQRLGMLTSANSINISRWLPQQIYYAIALSKWEENTAPLISVPSGNFGNICAGLVAHVSGLPIKHFIAACNQNDVFTRYIGDGRYEPSTSVSTISNAMDVGNPSNFIRILELFDNDYEMIKEIVSSFSFTDEETAETIKNVYKRSHTVLDPHTAVAFAGLKTYLADNPREKGFILATAHPLKFAPTVEKMIGQKIKIPEHIQHIMNSQKKATLIPPVFSELKKILQCIFNQVQVQITIKPTNC
jgi:threonine synthase